MLLSNDGRGVPNGDAGSEILPQIAQAQAGKGCEDTARTQQKGSDQGQRHPIPVWLGEDGGDYRTGGGGCQACPGM